MAAVEDRVSDNTGGEESGDSHYSDCPEDEKADDILPPMATSDMDLLSDISKAWAKVESIKQSDPDMLTGLSDETADIRNAEENLMSDNKCITETMDAVDFTHSSLKSETMETDSLNSVGEISVDDQSVTSTDNNGVSPSVVTCDKNENEIAKAPIDASDEKSVDEPSDGKKKKLKGDHDSLSKGSSGSNLSIDKNESSKKKGQSKKTDGVSKKKDSSKKSDSLASKLKHKISKTAESIRKTDQTEKGKSHDVAESKSKSDKKTEKKSDKKSDKKDKKSEGKSVKTKSSKSKTDQSKAVDTIKTDSDSMSGNKKDINTNAIEQTQHVDTKSDKIDSKSETDIVASQTTPGVTPDTQGTTVTSDNEQEDKIVEANACDSNKASSAANTGAQSKDDAIGENVENKLESRDAETVDKERRESSSDSDHAANSEASDDEDASEEGIEKEQQKAASETVEGTDENPETPLRKPEMRAKRGDRSDKKVTVHTMAGQDKEDVDFTMADFGSLSKQAEQRLASRRAAREEARLIRMKELERQQREMEEKQDRIFELTRDSGARAFSSSRRGSDDSTSSEDTRELKKQINELEDKYKKAMMNNAQLDNEKQKYRYEVDILKDKYEEIEESHIDIQRQHRDRCKELEQKKRDVSDLQIENEYLKLQITQRDKLIQEYGLVFVSNETVEEENDKKKKNRRRRKKEEQEKDTAALVTPDALTVLGKVNGNLDERLKQFSDIQHKLEEEIKKLRVELDEERAKNVLSEKYNSPKSHRDSSMNGPSSDGLAHEANMEAQKQLTEYRYKLKKAEQDITALEGNVIRLESQVKRYKGSADDSEKTIEDMKQEKRKIQRDLRDAQYKVEELNSQNQNLQTRIKTLKQERIDSIISGKS